MKLWMHSINFDVLAQLVHIRATGEQIISCNSKYARSIETKYERKKETANTRNLALRKEFALMSELRLRFYIVLYYVMFVCTWVCSVYMQHSMRVAATIRSIHFKQHLYWITHIA